MAILEPLLIALAALALIVASRLEPLSLKSLRSSGTRDTLRALSLTLALAILIPAMVLTKTTAVCLMPAVFYMVWARSGYGVRRFLRLALPPAALGIALWLAYFIGFVHPHYLEDHAYSFSANAYTGIEPATSPPSSPPRIHGMWMGHVLYPVFGVLALAPFKVSRSSRSRSFPRCCSGSAATSPSSSITTTCSRVITSSSRSPSPPSLRLASTSSVTPHAASRPPSLQRSSPPSHLPSPSRTRSSRSTSSATPPQFASAARAIKRIVDLTQITRTLILHLRFRPHPHDRPALHRRRLRHARS